MSKFGDSPLNSSILWETGKNSTIPLNNTTQNQTQNNLKEFFYNGTIFYIEDEIETGETWILCYIKQYFQFL